MRRDNQKSRDGFIYLIACHDYVKIGIANDVATRLSTMQVGNPYPIRLVNAFYSSNVVRDERLVQDRFWAYRARGEWFKMPGRLTDCLSRLETIDNLRVEKRCQL